RLATGERDLAMCRRMVSHSRNGTRLLPTRTKNRSRCVEKGIRWRAAAMLRKNGTPADLQRQWIGHSSLKTTDRYSHTHQQLEYRRNAAKRVGLDLIVGPNVASWTQQRSKDEVTAKPTV